jgi:hypothetical protein
MIKMKKVYLQYYTGQVHLGTRRWVRWKWGKGRMGKGKAQIKEGDWKGQGRG